MSETSQNSAHEDARSQPPRVRQTLSLQRTLIAVLAGAVAVAVSGVLALSRRNVEERAPILSSIVEDPQDDQDDKDRKGNHIDSFQVDGHEFIIQARAEEIGQIKHLIPQALEILKSWGVKYTGTPLTIQVEEKLESGSNSDRARLETSGLHYDIDRAQVCGDPGEPDLLPTNKLARNTLKISRGSLSYPGLDITLAHEFLHRMMGAVPLTLWGEGIPEALEEIQYEKSGKKIPEYELESTFVNAEKMRLLGVHETPWNIQNLGISLISGIPKPEEGFMRSCAAAVWKPYLQEHPDFLGRFIEQLRKEIGSPQTALPSEAALIRVATAVDPEFQDWYQQQPLFSIPPDRCSLIRGRISGDKLNLFYGAWVTQNITLVENIPPVTIPLRRMVGYMSLLARYPKNGILKIESIALTGFESFYKELMLPPGTPYVDIFDPIDKSWIRIQRDGK